MKKANPGPTHAASLLLDIRPIKLLLRLHQLGSCSLSFAAGPSALQGLLDDGRAASRAALLLL